MDAMIWIGVAIVVFLVVAVAILNWYILRIVPRYCKPKKKLGDGSKC